MAAVAHSAVNSLLQHYHAVPAGFWRLAVPDLMFSPSDHHQLRLKCMRQADAVLGDPADVEQAANGRQAASMPQSVAPGEASLLVAEQASLLHPAPDDSAGKLPAAPRDQSAVLGGSEAPDEPTNLATNGELLSNVDSRPMASASRPEPSAADLTVSNGADERPEVTAEPAAAAVSEASPPEAADAFPQSRQDVERLAGAGANAPDSSGSMPADPAAAQAVERTHQVLQAATSHAFALLACINSMIPGCNPLSDDAVLAQLPAHEATGDCISMQTD